MSLSARCSKCGTKYPSVPEKFAGRSIRCKKCGENVKVPAPAKQAEADPWDVGGDDFELEMPASAAPPRAGLPARPTSKPAAKRSKKSGGGIPGWVWWVAGGVAGVMLLCCGGLGLFVLVPGIKSGIYIQEEEQFIVELIGALNEVNTTLASVNDAASAQAAAEKIRGPLTQRMKALGDKGRDLEERSRGFSGPAQNAVKAGHESLKRNYDPQMKEANQKLVEQSRRLSRLPPDVRQPVGNAMTEFAQVMKSMRAL